MRHVKLEIEYKGVAQPYPYDRSLLEGCEQPDDFYLKLIRILAVEQCWWYEEAGPGMQIRPEYWGFRYRTFFRGHEDFPDGQCVDIFVYWISFGKRKGKDHTEEAVLFHWNADRSDCSVFVVPLYSPDCHSPDELFSGSGEKLYREDTQLTFLSYMDFDDSYDIHDHGSDTYYAGFIYDTATRELRYFLPKALAQG